MNYELAKKLKEAGFLQEYRKTDPAMDWAYTNAGDLVMLHDDCDTDWWIAQAYNDSWENLERGLLYVKTNWFKCPTLSELIEACGKKLHCLVHTIDGGIDSDREFWSVGVDNVVTNWVNATTPEEAVANLWLALNTHA
jgi:hypothetical protein